MSSSGICEHIPHHRCCCVFIWKILVASFLINTRNAAESYRLQLALKDDVTEDVYILCGGYRQHVLDWDGLLALGYDESKIVTISSSQLNAIPIGPAFSLNPNSVGNRSHVRSGVNDACPVANSSMACINTVGDVSNVLNGMWFNEFYDFPAQIPRSGDGWAFNECPAQSQLWSCYRHDYTWNKDSHGYKAESKFFQSFGCSLRSFNPYDFLTVLSGRRLLIGADSTSGQFFEALICSLHGFAKVKYDIDWYQHGVLCHKLSSRQCHILSGIVEYPQFNATIILLQSHLTELNGKSHGSNDLAEYIQYGKLGPRDILLLNFGMHFNDPVYYKVLLQQFATGLQGNQYASPVLIWRETSPQHYPTPNGYFLYGGSGECVQIKNLSLTYELDWRNRIAEEILAPFKVPILRVWGPTAEFWDAHVMEQDRMSEKGRKDCTHYCIPSGVMYFWRELLFNAVTAMDSV